MEFRRVSLIGENSKNLRDVIDITLAEEQEEHIYSAAIALAIDYEFGRKGTKMECYAMYDGGKIIGLVSYCYYTDDPVFKGACYRIRPIIIDRNHLEKGYEEAAMLKLLEKVRTLPHGPATAIYVSHHPEEVDIAAVYKKVGFTKTNLTWEEEDPSDDLILSIGL